MIIHWLCYCTAVSMLSFLPVIFCGLLELKRICVGSLLIVWSGNEYLQDLHCFLTVKANLWWICIACLEWTEAVHGIYCLFGVETDLWWICIACLEWKRICAGFVLLAWSVNEYVQVIYCLCMSVSALWIQLFCLIPAYYVLVTSYALDFQRHMLWSSTLCSMNWSERLLFPLLIFVVLFTITVYNYLSKLSGRNIV